MGQFLPFIREQRSIDFLVWLFSYQSSCYPQQKTWLSWRSRRDCHLLKERYLRSWPIWPPALSLTSPCCYMKARTALRNCMRAPPDLWVEHPEPYGIRISQPPATTPPFVDRNSSLCMSRQCLAVHGSTPTVATCRLAAQESYNSWNLVSQSTKHHRKLQPTRIVLC